MHKLTLKHICIDHTHNINIYRGTKTNSLTQRHMYRLTLQLPNPLTNEQ
jgi:hypothetical protein